MSSGWEGLTELLEQCVVRVTTPFNQGTGFVVRPGLVLTCRHVAEHVQEDDEVKLVDHRGRDLTAQLVMTSPEGTEITETGAARWPDLALLRMLGDGYDLPAVIMDSSAISPDEELAVAGYPAGALVEFQTRSFTAGFSANRDEGGHKYLRVDDDSIDPGLSGGPVLTKMGFVCGYVRLTLSEKTALGGFVVPVSEVLQVASQPLMQAFHDPGETAVPWVKLLGGLRMKEFGRDDQGRRFDRPARRRPVVNIEVLRQGAPPSPVGAWDVRAIDQPIEQRVTTADLGEGVLEAVDHWSRRHTIVSKDQVDLLGHVLFRALLPKPISQLVDDHRRHGDFPLVRLKVSETNLLSAIPWEYATSPDGLCLSIAEDVTFSRYVDRPSPPADPRGTARVLVVVNVPEGAGQANTLAERIKSGLAQGMIAAAAARLDLTVRSTMDYDNFAVLLAQGRWDVIHYIGTAWNSASLSFAGFGGPDDQADMTPVDLATFTAAVQKTDARVVVLQLQGQGSETSTENSSLLRLLGKHVCALVLADHATTTFHVLGFATAFYDVLARGLAVEIAVQAGRRRLANSPPKLGPATWLDYAAFGSISVTTTQASDVRLLTQLRDARGERRGPFGDKRTDGQHPPDHESPLPPAGSFEEGR